MTVTYNTELLKRIRRTDLLQKITQAENIIPMFKNGMYLGFSGFAEGTQRPYQPLWPTM